MRLSDKTIAELAVELNRIPLFGDLSARSLLRRVPFFQEIPDEMLDEIGPGAYLRTFDEGGVITRQGEYENTFYIVLQGSVEVSISAQDNPRLVLAKLEKNHFFGELGPLTGGPRTATVSAAESTVLLELSETAFLKLHKNVPAIRQKIDAVYLERSLTTHLRRVGLFSDLPDAVLRRIKEKIEMIDFERDDLIIRRGDPGDSLYIIRYGFVKVSVGSGPNEKVLAYLKDGSFFGEMSLVEGGTRTADVHAVSKVEAVRIGADVFRSIMDEFPEVKTKIEDMIAHREAKAEELEKDEDKASAMKFIVDVGAAQAAKMLVIDLNLCVRCHCCVRACAYAHDGYARLDRRGHRHKNILLPTTCIHCRDPECLLCAHGGIVRDKDGEVHHTPQCIHCGACARRCPYGNILVVDPEYDPGMKRNLLDQINDFLAGRKHAALKEGEAPKRQVVKCDMCADKPFIACVMNCPVNACRLITPEELLEMSGK